MEFNKATEYVKNNFFPRWDRKMEWKIKECDPEEIDMAYGVCHREEKIIYVSMYAPGLPGMRVLIHEIAHAVTYDGHGEKFLKRVRKAAEKAESLGHHDLATDLMKHVDETRNAPRFKAAWIYGKISDSVIDRPEMSFDEVVEYVRKLYGFSKEDFLRRFKRAEKVYQEEKDSQERAKATRGRLLGKL